MEKSFYINTATSNTSIAIYNGDKVIAEKSWPAEQNESEKLQPAVENMLDEQNLGPDDVDQMILCIGPGGFTSTRVGVSAVNAWTFARDIPVAEVTVFDLYEDQKSIIVVTANANEGWVKMPGAEPKFMKCEELELPDNFSFVGIVNEDWRKFLDGKGGQYLESGESSPKISGLKFVKKIVLPWYYKDPNITWSSKNT